LPLTPETNSLLAYTTTQIPDDRVTTPGSMHRLFYSEHTLTNDLWRVPA
jgi:hypothetical protein